jgi:outer membrane protein
MRHLLFATTLLSAVACGSAAFAQSPLDFDQPLVGKQAGTFMVRLRAIGVIPEDNSSSITGIPGARVNVTDRAAPELDFSYFLTDNIAFELIAASTPHNVSASVPGLGKVDVGSVWVLPPTLTVQYHFMPHSAFSPYVGFGPTVAFFYGSSPAGGAVTHFSVGNNVGFTFQAGIDYNITGHWFANFDVKQMILNIDSHVDALGTTLHAHDALDPLIVGLGIGYRF